MPGSAWGRTHWKPLSSQDNAAADCRGRGTMQEGVTHRAALAEFTWAQTASDQDINGKL